MAKQIALAHAGVQESDTAFLWVEADYEDGVPVYDVEFYVASTHSEYDYEIDAATGEIRSFDYDAENYNAGQDTGGTDAKSEDEIRQIALDRSPAQPTRTSAYSSTGTTVSCFMRAKLSTRVWSTNSRLTLTAAPFYWSGMPIPSSTDKAICKEPKPALSLDPPGSAKQEHLPGGPYRIMNGKLPQMVKSAV